MSSWNKIFYIVLLSFACGCTSTKYITIDILEPAQQNIFKQQSDIALINKVVNPEPSRCVHYYIFDNQRRFDSTCFQQIISDGFMDGMKYIIDDSQFFTNNSDIIYPEKTNSSETIAALSSQEYVFALEQIQIKDETFFSPSGYGGYGVTKAIFSIKLSLYNTISKEEPEILIVADTVYWISDEMTHYEFNFLEQYRQHILTYLSFDAGKKCASKFFPSWKNVNRCLLITNDKISQQASELALSGSWERSNYFWEALSKEKEKRKASAAWFNRAVYQEINGDFQTALNYLNHANKTYFRKVHEQYLRILKKRIDCQNKLDALMDK